ncbi:DUF3918 family protein [Neobacillus massiliamazoniensis]|jgi:hypothetical protein|nr:DUF3918 family protein [Neobacillus massiliamazoniensis]
MNRVMTSMIAIGAGIAAYNLAQRTNMITGRNMRRVQRRMMRAFR